MYHRDDETIIAQCTPRGSGALALIRLSGIDAISISSTISHLPSGKKLSEALSHTIHYGYIVDDCGQKIDQVLFSVMHAPKTFTGQNTVEVTCHNNQFIVESIIARAIRQGARRAGQGEFSARAFSNGKIDLLQAEAINDLIHAQTEHVLKKSLAQLEGTFSHWLNDVEKKLVRILAWCEASFEFLDEEEEFGAEMATELIQIQENLTHTKKIYDIRKQVREGFRLALIGTVNAGKSSLFNLLLGHYRAIVTDRAGTTRDSIEASVYRANAFWTLIDTAGIRQSNDTIELEGIKRSWDEAHKADCILLVHDSSRLLTPSENELYRDLIERYRHKIIIVANKCDLPMVENQFTNFENNILISAQNPQHVDVLEASISNKISLLMESHNVPFLLNERQYHILLSLEEKLNNLYKMLTVPGTIHYELVSFNLRETLELVSELSGKTITEAGMDKVFKEFCVGK